MSLNKLKPNDVVINRVFRLNPNGKMPMMRRVVDEDGVPKFQPYRKWFWPKFLLFLNAILTYFEEDVPDNGVCHEKT